MPKLEITPKVLEQAAHDVLLRTIRDLYPQGFEHFYPTPPDRARMGSEWSESVGTNETLDVEIDRLINEEQDS